MTFIELMLLYFCTVVSVLYLVCGGYTLIKAWWKKKIAEAAAAQTTAQTSQEDGTA